jgi:hypothetical protein
MLIRTLKSAPSLDIEPFFTSGSVLPKARTILVETARDWGADYILWMDADHIFPAETLLKLLSHDLDVVGCNYARRPAPNEPILPTAARTNGDDLQWVRTTPEKAKQGDVEEVEQMGLGVCLMRASVFDRLQAPLFINDWDGEQIIGEDTYLCRKLRAAGIRLFVDHALSWSVGHLAEQSVENIHTLTGAKGTNNVDSVSPQAGAD